jgi:hypothetical protein
MRKIIQTLVYLLGALGALQALATTPTPLPVQGNLTSIVGTGQPYAGVKIQLQNCASPVSINGYSVIVQTGYQVQANSSGVVNTSVWSNDLIDCNGTTGNSQYQLSYVVNGAVQGTPQCYQVISTQGVWNLNTQQPITCSQSPYNPQDAQYTNLNVLGCFSVDGGPCSDVSLVGTLDPPAQLCPSAVFVGTLATSTTYMQYVCLSTGWHITANGCGTGSPCPIDSGGTGAKDANTALNNLINASAGLPPCPGIVNDACLFSNRSISVTGVTGTGPGPLTFTNSGVNRLVAGANRYTNGSTIGGSIAYFEYFTGGLAPLNGTMGFVTSTNGTTTFTVPVTVTTSGSSTGVVTVLGQVQSDYNCTSVQPTDNFQALQIRGSPGGGGDCTLPANTQAYHGAIAFSQMVVQQVQNQHFIGSGSAGLAESNAKTGSTILMPSFVGSAIAGGTYVSGITGASGAAGTTCRVYFDSSLGGNGAEADVVMSAVSGVFNTALAMYKPGNNTLSSQPTAASAEDPSMGTATGCPAQGTAIAVTTILQTDIMQQHCGYTDKWTSPGHCQFEGIANLVINPPISFKGIGYHTTGPKWDTRNPYGDFPVIGLPGLPVFFKNVAQWTKSETYDIGYAEIGGYGDEESNIAISGFTGTGPGTLTFTQTNAGSTLIAGHPVYLDKFTGGAAFLNGQVVTVLTGVTPNTFQATTTATTTGSSSGTAQLYLNQFAGNDWVSIRVIDGFCIFPHETTGAEGLLAFTGSTAYHFMQNDTANCAKHPYVSGGASAEGVLGDGEQIPSGTMGDGALKVVDSGQQGNPNSATGPQTRMTGNGSLYIDQVKPLAVTPIVTDATIFPPGGSLITNGTTYGAHLPDNTARFYRTAYRNFVGATALSPEMSITTGSTGNINAVNVPVPLIPGSGYYCYDVCGGTTAGAEGYMATVCPTSLTQQWTDLGTITPGGVCSNTSTFAFPMVTRLNSDKIESSGIIPDATKWTNVGKLTAVWQNTSDLYNQYTNLNAGRVVKVPSGELVVSYPWTRGLGFQEPTNSGGDAGVLWSYQAPNLNITGVTVTGTGPYTYTFTNSGTNTLQANQNTVWLTNFTSGASNLVGVIGTVLSTGLTPTTFEITSPVAITGSSTGIATPFELTDSLTNVVGSGAFVQASGLQGTDTNLLTSGTVSGTAIPLCTDANGGATTVGCPSGSSPLTTKGDLYGFSTVNARVPVGADTYVLTADSTQALGVKWAAGGGEGSGTVNGGTQWSPTYYAATGTAVSGTTPFTGLQYWPGSGAPAAATAAQVVAVIGSTAVANATSAAGLNGTALSGLASGFLYNTTGTGIPTAANQANLGTLINVTSGQAIISGGTGAALTGKALAGTGAGITTGPASANSGAFASFSGTTGQLQDSGISSTAPIFSGIVRSSSTAYNAIYAPSGGVTALDFVNATNLTWAVGAAAGASPTVACAGSVNCGWNSGTLNLHTDTGTTSTGVLLTGTDAYTHTNRESCHYDVYPANSSYVPTATYAPWGYVSESTTVHTLNAITSALTASSYYVIVYSCR